MNRFSNFRIPYADDKVFGFLLLIFLLGCFTIVPVFSEPIDSPRTFIWSVFIGLALIFWLSQRDRKIHLSRWSLGLLIGFVGWATFATIFSLDWVNSLVGVNIRMTSSVWFFLIWSLTITLLTTLSKEKLSALLKVVSMIVGIISVWAICQYYGLGYYAGINSNVRQLIPSFLGNPNFAAMFVAGGLFVNLWAMYKSSGWFRLLQFFFLACHIMSLMVFTSRGAILGIVAGFLVLGLGLLIKKSWKLLFVSSVILLAVMILNMVFFNIVRENTLVDISTDQSASQRWYAWDNVAQEILDKPLLGSGLGNYFIAYRQNQDAHLANMNWFDDPHNLVLHLAANGGILFAVIYLLLCALALWSLYRKFRAGTETDSLSLFVAAGLVAWLVAALFNPVSISNWLLSSLLFAVALKTESFIEIKQRTFAIAGYIVGGILVAAGVSFILSEMFLWRSIKNSEVYSYQTSEYYANIAVKLNPTQLVALNQLAMSKYFNDDHEGSYQILLRTEQLHPKSAGVYQQTLTGYLNLYNKTNDEKFKQQIYESAKAYEASYPNHQFIHQNLSNIYMQIGDFDNSLDHTRRWVVLSQGNYGSWLFLSTLYQALQKGDLAAKAKADAFKAAPSSELRVNNKSL